MTSLRLQLSSLAMVGAAGVMVFAACGDSATAVNDASPVDAAADIDANLDNLTVRVLSVGRGVANAPVIIHDSTGTVVSENMTDDNGEFSTQIAGGEMVTAASFNEGILLTWEGVQPGDELVFPVPSGSGSVGNANITLPGAFAGAVTYVVSVGGCGSTEAAPLSVVRFSLFSDCLDAAGNTVVVASALDANDVVLATTFMKGVATVPNGDTDVTLGAFSDADVGDWTVVLANPDANRPIVDGEFSLMADGFAFFHTPTQIDPTPIVARDAVFGDFARYNFALESTLVGSVDNAHLVLGSVAAADAMTTIDLAARTMVDATAVARDDTNPTRPIFTITRPAAPTDVDGVVTLFGGAANGGARPFLWLVVGNDIASVSVPEIPASLSAFSTRIENMQSVAVRADFYADYDEARGPLGGIIFNNPLPNAAATFDAHAVRISEVSPARQPREAPARLGSWALRTSSAAK